MLDQVETKTPVITNGINVTAFEEIVGAVRDDPGLARFVFRASNRWQDAGYNLTTVSGFFAAGEEQGTDGRHFTLAADEPAVLLSTDRAPSPAELLLHSLAACLTSTIVYKAAAKGIRVHAIESSFEGDIVGLRFLELSDTGRLGYQGIRARFRVAADATADEIRELAEFSPILDVVRNGSPVSLEVEKL